MKKVTAEDVLGLIGSLPFNGIKIKEGKTNFPGAAADTTYPNGRPTITFSREVLAYYIENSVLDLLELVSHELGHVFGYYHWHESDPPDVILITEWLAEKKGFEILKSLGYSIPKDEQNIFINDMMESYLYYLDHGFFPSKRILRRRLDDKKTRALEYWIRRASKIRERIKQ